MYEIVISENKDSFNACCHNYMKMNLEENVPGSIVQSRAQILFFYPCHMACATLVPWPGIEPSLPTLEG